MFCGAILEQAQNCLRTDKYYEAHQLYRTIYLRYKNKHRFNEVEPIIYPAIIQLLGRNQQMLGIDLSFCYVENLYKVVHRAEAVNTKFQNLKEILHLMVGPKREEFISRVLKWSSSYEGQPFCGSPEIHEFVGDIYSLEGDHKMARFHFMRGGNPQKCAQTLLSIHVLPDEVDLLLAQAVLQLLCLENKVTAGVVLSTFATCHPSIESSFPYRLPMLNLLHFLLKAVEMKEVKVFKVLCDKYKAEIARDSDFVQYVEKIGSLYFGMSCGRSRNMFEMVFDSLFSGDASSLPNMDDVD